MNESSMKPLLILGAVGAVGYFGYQQGWFTGLLSSAAKPADKPADKTMQPTKEQIDAATKTPPAAPPPAPSTDATLTAKMKAAANGLMQNTDTWSYYYQQFSGKAISPDQFLEIMAAVNAEVPIADRSGTVYNPDVFVKYAGPILAKGVNGLGMYGPGGSFIPVQFIHPQPVEFVPRWRR